MHLQDLITANKPLVTAGMSAFPSSPKLRRKYQFESRFDDQVLLYEEDPKDPKVIWLPRAIAPVGAEDKRREGHKAHFPKCPVPRPHQVEMFDAIDDAIKNTQNGVFVAPTGFGKTVLGYLMAYKIQRKTLVITTKSDIYEQWLKGAETFLGLPECKIGEVRQDKCEISDTDFCVALVQSLSDVEKYPSFFWECFGLVIFDECHRFPANSFSRVIGKFPAIHRFGLTATPDRKDGKEILFHSHIGPTLFRAPEKMMVPQVMRFRSEWMCPRVPKKDKKTGKVKITTLPHQAGKTAHVDKILAVDTERNELIARLTRLAHGKGRTTVVFSTQHMHLKEIEKALLAQGVSAHDFGYYVSASTKAEKKVQYEAKGKPIILTTYQMMGEGTSIDWVDTAILAMPRSDVRQPVGRIRREFENKRFPLVFDIVDRDSPVYKSYANSRNNWYKEIGAEVKEMN